MNKVSLLTDIDLLKLHLINSDCFRVRINLGDDFFLYCSTGKSNFIHLEKCFRISFILFTKRIDFT